MAYQFLKTSPTLRSMTLMDRLSAWWRRHIIDDDPHSPALSRLDELDGIPHR